MSEKNQAIDRVKFYTELNQAICQLNPCVKYTARAKRGLRWTTPEIHNLNEILCGKVTINKQKVIQTLRKYCNVGTVQAHIQSSLTYSQALEYIVSLVEVGSKSEANLTTLLSFTSISTPRWSKLWRNRNEDNNIKLYAHEYIELVNTLFNIIYAGKNNETTRTDIRNKFLDYLLIENRLIHDYEEKDYDYE